MLGTPAPNSATECGLPPALSAIVSVPLREPVALGVKLTPIVQKLPGSSVKAGGLTGQIAAPSLATIAKSPPVVMLSTRNGAAPLLRSVTSRTLLVVLIGWLPKSSRLGISSMPGMAAAQLRV